VLAEIAVDRRLRVDERMEDIASQAPACDGGEKALDGIDPRAGGGREMKGPARVPGEPGAHFGMLVGRIIVPLTADYRGLQIGRGRDDVSLRYARDRSALRAQQQNHGTQRARTVPEYSKLSLSALFGTKNQG
jgi:hypothetical protein